jgi:MFS family permease
MPIPVPVHLPPPEDPRPQPAPVRALPLWLLVLTAGTIVGIAQGRSQVMGLYLAPVTKALEIGREPFAFAMAVSQLLTGIGAPLSGAIIDRFGVGRVLVVGVLATIAGLWMMLSAATPFDLLLSGVLLGLGASSTGINALVGTVGRLAPPEKRLQAIASLGIATGIGGFLAFPYVHLFIEGLGWQGSLLVLVATTAVMLPLIWPLAGGAAAAQAAVRDQTMGQALAEAIGHPSYLLLTVGYFVCGFHVSFIGVHLPAFTSDQGLPSWVGPTALSVVGITNILGTWLAGRSAGIIGKRTALCLIYLGRAVLFLGFLYLPMTPLTVIALAGAIGFIWLATIPLTSGLVATFFGTTWMSMLFGIVFLSHQIGSFMGVWLGGRLYDLTRSYDAMWWISIGLGLAAALIHWPIRERPVARLAMAGSG